MARTYRYALDAPYSRVLCEGVPPSRVAVGIDPGKHTVNACRLGWTLTQGGPLLCAVEFLRVLWNTPGSGWPDLCALFVGGGMITGVSSAPVSLVDPPQVASETQWADDNILDRWDGVQECVQTTGVIRAAGLACDNQVSLWAPTEWRAVSLRGYGPLGSRRQARQTEQRFACELLGVDVVQPDMAAALGIAVAQMLTVANSLTTPDYAGPVLDV